MEHREDNYDKAMGYALRLLGFRMRTERELREKMQGKGYGTEIEQVIARLKEYAYIDDTAYTETFIRSKSKPTGRRRFKYELGQKGVPGEVVDEVLSTQYTLEQELAEATRLARKFLANIQKHQQKDKGEQESEHETDSPALPRRDESLQKIYKKLLTRGFSHSISMTVLKNIASDVLED